MLQVKIYNHYNNNMTHYRGELSSVIYINCQPDENVFIREWHRTEFITLSPK